MNKYLLLFVCLLSACSQEARIGRYSGEPLEGAHRERCLRGVIYYQIGPLVAPAFKPDGTLYTCQGE